MVPSPCRCGSLRCWCLTVAVLETVGWIINIVGILVPSLNNLNSLEKSDPPSYEQVKDIPPLVIAGIVFSVVRIFVDVLLFVGAWKRIAASCWTWIAFSEVLFVFDSAQLIVPLTKQIIPYVVKTLLVVGYSIYFLLRFYLIYVVYAFIEQLREERKRQRVNPEQGDSSAVEAGGAPRQSQWPMRKAMETPTDPAAKAE